MKIRAYAVGYELDGGKRHQCIFVGHNAFDSALSRYDYFIKQMQSMAAFNAKYSPERPFTMRVYMEEGAAEITDLTLIQEQTHE